MQNDNESLSFNPLSGVVVNTTKMKKLTVVQPRRKVSAERKFRECPARPCCGRFA